MTISEIQIVPVKAHDGLLGFASCVLENSFYIGSIAVFSKLDGGFRLVYPTKKIGEKNLNYHHPINSETSKEIETAICQKAEQIFGNYSL
jgi:stage V sporulation protein G